MSTQYPDLFFSTVKSELGERFESNGEAKIKLFVRSSPLSRA